MLSDKWNIKHEVDGSFSTVCSFDYEIRISVVLEITFAIKSEVLALNDLALDSTFEFRTFGFPQSY